MKYICSWSGGKESTASIILTRLNNEPLDIVLFSEVMFNETVSGELPDHIEFIHRAKRLFESWGIEVKILRSNQTYMDLFNHVIERPRKHMHHKGMKYGFPISTKCVVKRDLKLKPLYSFYEDFNEEYIQYIGIAADEYERLEAIRNIPNAVSLLEKYNYTSKMAKQLCIDYNLLSPAYNYSKRQGCWFCPNSKREECRRVKELYPETWNSFVALEKEPNLCHYKWNVYGETLQERDFYLSNFKEITIFDL